MSSAVCVIFDCNIYIDVAEALGFDAWGCGRFLGD